MLRKHSFLQRNLREFFIALKKENTENWRFSQFVVLQRIPKQSTWTNPVQSSLLCFLVFLCGCTSLLKANPCSAHCALMSRKAARTVRKVSSQLKFSKKFSFSAKMSAFSMLSKLTLYVIDIPNRSKLLLTKLNYVDAY